MSCVDRVCKDVEELLDNTAQLENCLEKTMEGNISSGAKFELVAVQSKLIASEEAVRASLATFREGYKEGDLQALLAAVEKLNGVRSIALLSLASVNQVSYWDAVGGWLT